MSKTPQQLQKSDGSLAGRGASGELESRGGRSLELREAVEGSLEMIGHASVFDTPYEVDGFTETVRRGAFKRSLGQRVDGRPVAPDVQLLLGHGRGGSGLPIGGTRWTPPNLFLAEDARGLRVEALLDREDPDVKAVESKLKRGGIAMSFAFKVTGEDGQRWSDDYRNRELLSVELGGGDVSLVSRGANPEASATLRAEDLSIEQRSARAAKLGKLWTGEASLRAIPAPHEPWPPCEKCGGSGVIECDECHGSNQGKSDGEPDPDVQGSGTADGRSADDYLMSRMANELLAIKERAAEDEYMSDSRRALSLATGSDGSRNGQ